MLLLSACFLFFPLPHLSRVMVPLFIHAVACRILPIRLVSKLKFLLRSRAVIPLRPLLTCGGFQTAEYNFCCSLDCPQPSFFHEYSLFFMRLNACPSHLIDNLHQEIVVRIFMWLFMRRLSFHEMYSSKLQIKEVWISLWSYWVISQTELFKVLPLFILIGATIFPCWLWGEKSISANVHSYWFIFPFGFLI